MTLILALAGVILGVIAIIIIRKQEDRIESLEQILRNSEK